MPHRLPTHTNGQKPLIKGVMLQKSVSLSGTTYLPGGYGYFLSLPATAASPGESGGVSLEAKE